MRQTINSLRYSPCLRKRGPKTLFGGFVAVISDLPSTRAAAMLKAIKKQFPNRSATQWIINRVLLAIVLSVAVMNVAVSSDDTKPSDKQLNLQRDPASLPTLEFTDCEIGDSATQARMSASCATLNVPLDREQQDGQQLTLHIAKLAATDRYADREPITLLAGGPGQSALTVFPGVQIAFQKIRKTRDIYLIDQRGTGQSHPLSCDPNGDSMTAESIDPFQFDREQTIAESARCLEQLAANPRFFTTSVAVQDLDAVRDALGIERWALYGVSYGTRVALHYLKRFPARVSSLILDAVVPPDLSLGASIPIDTQRAFELISERCQQTEACADTFPNLAERTSALITSLRESPKTVTFENFTTGQLDSMDYTDVHLSLTIRTLAYSTYGASMLPMLLHGAYENDHFAPLARQATLQLNGLQAGIASGLHSAVICTEDIPFMEIDETLKQAIDNTWLGYTPLEAALASCEPWPAGLLDDDFKEPVISDVPTLILSGETDPVTPPSFGDQVARHLSQSRHLVMPGQGHMQAWLGCMPAIMAEFLDAASAAAIDVTCLERQQPAPFFIDANGPMP